MSISLPHRRTFLAAATVAAMVAVPAFAHPISSAFDGTYTGSSQLQKPLSQPSCKESQGYKLTIHDGMMHGTSTNGSHINGFITSSGFFTGIDKLPNGTKSLFQGSVKDGSLVGGLFTGHYCASVVTANKS